MFNATVLLTAIGVNTEGDAAEKLVNTVHNVTRGLLAGYSILLCLVGIPGNALAIRVLCSRGLLQNFLTPYLIWLAVLNIICLLIEMSRLIILGLCDIDFRDFDPLICFWHHWLVDTSTTLCNWLLVIITLVRWLYLRFPGRVHPILKPLHVCAFNLALLITVGLVERVLLPRRFVHAAELHKYHLHRISEKYQCAIDSQNMSSIISEVLTCFFPILALAVFSKLIYSAVKVRTRASDKVFSLLNRNRRSVRDKHLAFLLLASNVQFCMTNIPSSAVSLSWETLNVGTSDLQEEFALLILYVTKMLLYGGYATNCIIYCFFGSRFRTELLKLLSEWKLCPRYYENAPFSGTRSLWTSGVEPSTRRPSEAAGAETGELVMNNKVFENTSSVLAAEHRLCQVSTGVDPLVARFTFQMNNVMH